MALANMKVFNKTVQTMATESSPQDVEKFNAASGGAITLTAEGFEGDYRYENFGLAARCPAPRRSLRHQRLRVDHQPAQLQVLSATRSRAASA